MGASSAPSGNVSTAPNPQTRFAQNQYDALIAAMEPPITD